MTDKITPEFVKQLGDIGIEYFWMYQTLADAGLNDQEIIDVISSEDIERTRKAPDIPPGDKDWFIQDLKNFIATTVLASRDLYLEGLRVCDKCRNGFDSLVKTDGPVGKRLFCPKCLQEEKND